MAIAESDIINVSPRRMNRTEGVTSMMSLSLIGMWRLVVSASTVYQPV